MDVSYPLTEAIPSRADAAVEIPQLARRTIFKIWAAAALPMAALAWLVAPFLADRFAGDGHVPMAKALIVALTIGLVWQVVLVAILVGREQRTLRWSAVRKALWLRSPRSPRSGRVGGRIWLVLIPLILLFAAAPELLSTIAGPEDRELRHDRRVGRRQGVPGRGLRLVRRAPRDVPVIPSSARSSCSAGSSFRA